MPVSVFTVWNSTVSTETGSKGLKYANEDLK